MADKEISGLTAASTLDGTEEAHILQGANSRRATTQDIANLAKTLATYLDIPEIAEPSSPAANTLRLYGIVEDGFSVLETKDENGVVYRLGEDIFRIARNTSGSTITKGQMVYYSGSTSSKPNVGLAQADAAATMPAVGMTIASIANNDFGIIAVIGKIEGLDTSAFTVGDEVFISSSTAGGLTATRPVHPNFAQAVGTVEASHVSTGIILLNTVPFKGGHESGTNQNAFAIGDGTAGAKELEYVNDTGRSSLIWTPTAARTLTLPDNTGTIATEDGSPFARVRAVATANVALASELENADTIDSVTLATGDLVLLTGQTAPAENGVYTVVASGAASRTPAFASWNQIAGTYFSVMEGTAKADTLWRCTSDRGGTIGTTDVVIAEFSGGGSSGKVAQVVNTQTGAYLSGTTQIPIDDTIPQNTEGDEYMTLAITPTDATSTLYITVVGMFSSDTIDRWLAAALFKDSDAAALAVGSFFESRAGAGKVLTFTHKMTAGATSSITFKVRAGLGGSGTTRLNGGASRHYGGAQASSITITEVLP